MDKLITRARAGEIVHQLKLEHKSIVWTNGCFDILHIGHIENLKQAKALGDVLFVGLNSDASVKKNKGSNRPLFSEIDRAKVLSALQYVDYIIIFDAPSPIELLKGLKPDYYVKGGDYTLETIDQQERKMIESYGGKIILLPFVNGVSTSNIIKKIEQL